MEIIRNAVKCFHCNNVLESPVLLPCGQSVCKFHVDIHQTAFFCLRCDMNHEIPYGGFFPNNSLESILKTKIDKCDLCLEYNQALKSCHKLNQMLDDIDIFKNDPNFYLSELIVGLKKEVEVKRKNLKLKIDREADGIIGELDKYEKDCRHVLKQKDFNLKQQDLYKSVDKIQHDLDKWLNELKTLEKDEVKWKTIKENTERIIKDLEFKSNKLKNELLLKRKMQLRTVEPVEFITLSSNIKKYFTNSNIIDSNILENELIDLCEFSAELQWRRLYSASEQGFSTKEFHRNCDNRAKTLIIVKSTSGSIFGGYTEAFWDKSDQYKTDGNAFLFSLVNKHNTPVKLKIDEKAANRAIYCGSRHGPSFGLGTGDISIGFDSEDMTQGVSNIGASYLLPDFISQSNETRLFFSETSPFYVMDIEVFKRDLGDFQFDAKKLKYAKTND